MNRLAFFSLCTVLTVSSVLHEDTEMEVFLGCYLKPTMAGGAQYILGTRKPCLAWFSSLTKQMWPVIQEKKIYRISSFPNFAIWIIAQIIHLKTKSNQATVLKIE